jgi:hypothetical protein
MFDFMSDVFSGVEEEPAICKVKDIVEIRHTAGTQRNNKDSEKWADPLLCGLSGRVSQIAGFPSARDKLPTRADSIFAAASSRMCGSTCE